jgi:PAS domain S-box-containing protein
VSELGEISDFVQQVCEAMADVVEIEITIFDDKLQRIAGTGRHRNEVGRKIPHTAAFAKALAMGIPIFVFNPPTDDACKQCSLQDKCSEVANIAFPIINDGLVKGVIALIAFNEEQRQRLMYQQKSYSRFLTKLAELICSKLQEKKANADLVQASRSLETIMSSLPDGVIFTDAKGMVVSDNPAARKILGLQLDALRGQNLNAIDPLHPLLQTLNDGYAISNKEISRDVKGKNRHYLCSTQPIYHEGIIVGAIAYLKDYESVRIIVNEVEGHNNFMTFDHIIGSHPSLLAVIERATRVAGSNSTILIQGESGTGKELFARGIHGHSRHGNGPFIAINCAAIPETLLESELFGYEGGAFTGARSKGKPGKLELAGGGTLFLDEIADMPLNLQAKLLRVLEEKRITRLGGIRSIAVDTRIVAATNRNLEEQVSKGEFREDLFYRLNVVPLKIPPLRERYSDIRVLAMHFLAEYRHDNPGIEGFSQAVLNAFIQYGWPGNVRELKNAVEYAVNMTDEPTIQIRHIPEKIRPGTLHSTPVYMPGPELMRMNEMEALLLRLCVERYGTSEKAKKEIASRLGISRASIYRKMNKYGISGKRDSTC